ncbi:coagulation factor XI-like [Mastacembelus armatus]|uniref:Coagulation factor XI-like n=1 Tax=Mastacembelus armatus TaxID=205130 RepID=A0A3Q3LIA0_9TELE|nr:coagulation factor XI-like [Mastacembelus armatus]
METHLILVGLLCLCSLSFSQECNQELLENVDFPGSDITSLYSPDVEHCRQLCTQHPSCLFFTFVRPDWTVDNRHFFCYLKSTPSGQPDVRTPLVGVTSGFSLKPCTLDSMPCLFKVYQNVDFLGADYRALFTADYEECQRVCTHEPGCQFFTFINENFNQASIRNKCHLKFSWTVPRSPDVERKTGVVSGFSHQLDITTQFFESACQTKLFPNTDIPGHDFQNLKAASPEHCLALCSSHPLCTYFSFISNDFTCFLKNNMNQMVTKVSEGVTSGIPARYCQLDVQSWAAVTYDGVDFSGSDIRDEMMDDADTCQRTCTADPKCLFYTYVNDKFISAEYRRRCYLKRIITIPAPPKITKLNNAVSGFSQRSCLSMSYILSTV